MNKLNHLALIMDGNGRWAEHRKLPRSIGHKRGLDKAKEVIEWCMSKGISYVSLYVFSTENWARPKSEIDQLFSLASNYISKFKSFCDRGIKVVVSGSCNRLSEDLIEKINNIQLKTAKNDKITVNLCINYGGQQEIIDVCNKLIENNLEINVANFDKIICARVPMPEVIFRTGGHRRLSNFLLYQCAYSEMYFSDTLWPDLSMDELGEIHDKFSNCSRNHGGLANG